MSGLVMCHKKSSRSTNPLVHRCDQYVMLYTGIKPEDHGCSVAQVAWLHALPCEIITNT